jgi:hypothetical protein
VPFPPAPPALLASTPVGTRAVASRDAVSRCSSASATARGRRKPTQRRSRGGDLPPTFMPASTTPTAERREGGLTMVHCRWNRAERRAQGALSGQRPPGQLRQGPSSCGAAQLHVAPTEARPPAGGIPQRRGLLPDALLAGDGRAAHAGHQPCGEAGRSAGAQQQRRAGSQLPGTRPTSPDTNALLPNRAWLCIDHSKALR